MKWHCPSGSQSSSWQPWLHPSPRLLSKTRDSVPTSSKKEASLLRDRAGVWVIRWNGDPADGAAKPPTALLLKYPPKRQQQGLGKSSYKRKKKKRFNEFPKKKRWDMPFILPFESSIKKLRPHSFHTRPFYYLANSASKQGIKPHDNLFPGQLSWNGPISEPFQRDNSIRKWWYQEHMNYSHYWVTGPVLLTTVVSPLKFKLTFVLDSGNKIQAFCLCGNFITYKPKQVDKSMSLKTVRHLLAPCSNRLWLIEHYMAAVLFYISKSLFIF